MLSFQMTAFCVVVTTVVQIVIGVPSGTLVHTRRDVGIALSSVDNLHNFEVVKIFTP